MLIRSTLAILSVAAAMLLAQSVAAEIRIEERDGVLYVRNVEPPQPVVAKPSSPPNEPVAAQTAGPYRDLIRAAATRHALAPELIESVILVESNFDARAVSRKGGRGAHAAPLRSAGRPDDLHEPSLRPALGGDARDARGAPGCGCSAKQRCRLTRCPSVLNASRRQSPPHARRCSSSCLVTL